MKKSARQLVEEAQAQITTHPVARARELHGRADVQFVDVRDVRELEREGVIPGAIHAPRGMIEFWFDPESPYFRPEFGQDKEYVLFCALGWRSALAAKTLQDMGVPRVADIEGGFTAWKESGAPVAEKAAKKPKADAG
ncbi:rhodanese-like domain-containing protein [Piscinibacter terrae]|uniref:Rhodanese-like domain-containing protein n=1 Tax=Piscinibacter terrae TaxID=2496871 RepID=A0A3N7HLN2_9BURK|nr:rhodanese-like domain-containing protein [Albitalea terrae]RQP23027.1 rhodanese-like domain-containing protein [Albitalea terrae]